MPKAGYLLHAPFPLEKTSYDAASGTVIYRSKLHATRKHNLTLDFSRMGYERVLDNAPYAQRR
jgi:hypothetical protein